MDSFINWLKEKELNEMSPVKMRGNAPFESLDNESKSIDSMESDFTKIGKIRDYSVFIHNKFEIIKVAKLFFDDVLKEERWAIIAEMSFKSEKIKSINKLINNKKAIRLHTIHVRESNRRDGIASDLYNFLLSKDTIVISDSIQYEGAVKLWKSFTKIPGIVLYIWNEKEDKIISKMTAKTHDNSVWSNGDLGDYSKMSTRLILMI